MVELQHTGHYRSQRDADEFLNQVPDDNRGIGVLHGIESSGKTTIVGQFVRSLPSNIPAAVVDGTGIGASELLVTMLAQFGYKGSIDLTDGRLNLLAELSERVIREKRAPLLVLKNLNRMYPSGLGALRELAALTINRQFALRFILVNKRDYSSIIESQKINPIGTRLVDTFELGPLSAKKTVKYLHAKLRAIAWVDRLPIRREHIYPLAAHGSSVRVADTSTANLSGHPDAPRLLVSANGKLVREFEVTQPKTVIDRARLNDIVINNEYVGKYHAMLFFNNNTLILVDLKSSNGIHVNSRRVRGTVLRHDDIIEIGNHHIKLSHSASRMPATSVKPDLVDTSIMKTVADMRRAVASKFLRIAPVKRDGSS